MARGPGLIPVVLAASAGLVAVLWSPWLLPAWALPAPLALAWALPRRWHLTPALRGLLLAAVVGGGWALWHAHTVLAAQWPVARHGEDRTLVGHIASIPEQRGEGWRFRFDPEGDPLLAAPLRVSWYRDRSDAKDGADGGTVEAAAVPGFGDCWRFTLRLRAPRGSVSPGAFDYERWIFANRLAATAYVRDAEACGAPAPLPLWRRARADLDDKLGRWLEDRPGLAWVRALVVANRNGISDDQWQALRVTGTSHLLAISGLHVGLVAGSFLLLGSALWRRSAWLCGRLAAPRAGVLTGSLAALAYAALAGFTVPTQRALLMWSVLALALWLGRSTRPWHVLALAWLAVLLADALAVLMPGTWLSFVAVGALIFLSAGRVPGAWPWWQQLLRLQLGLMVAMAPATLLFFDGVSVLAPMVNALAIPLFGLLLPVLLVAVALAWTTVWTWPLERVAEVLAGFAGALEWVADQAGALWWPAAPGMAAVACAALAAVLLLLPRGVPLRPLALVLLLPLLWPAPGPAPGTARVAVLDVGQGLAVVVRTARHALVFDAGPAWPGGFDAGDAIVAPWLRRQGLGRIDRLMLSHPHMDHYGGMAALAREFRVGERFGGFVRAGPPQEKVMGAGAGRNGTGRPGAGGGRARACDSRQAWRWDGVDFEVLHPLPDAPWGVNNISCVLRVVAGGTVLLLTGDIEARGERALLRRGAQGLAADVVVAPHHGSRTSSTAWLVAATEPAVVVHSAGWRNRFGHPHDEVVARWQGAGAAQYFTARDGTISFAIGAGGVTDLRRARLQSRRIWRAPALR